MNPNASSNRPIGAARWVFQSTRPPWLHAGSEASNQPPPYLGNNITNFRYSIGPIPSLIIPKSIPTTRKILLGQERSILEKLVRVAPSEVVLTSWLGIQARAILPGEANKHPVFRLADL